MLCTVHVLGSNSFTRVAPEINPVLNKLRQRNDSTFVFIQAIESLHGLFVTGVSFTELEIVGPFASLYKSISVGIESSELS